MNLLLRLRKTDIQKILQKLSLEQLLHKDFIYFETRRTSKKMDPIKVLITIIASLSIIANIIALYCLNKRKRKNNYIVLCMNLSISDLIQSVFGYLPALFLNKSSKKDSLLCKLSAFFTAFPAFASISLLTVIALSRMALLNAPFLSNQVGYKTLFSKLGPLSWIYSIVWAALPLLGLSSYKLEATYSRCSIYWMPRAVHDKIFLVLLVGFCFFVPVVIIIASCLFTARVMHSKFKYFSHTYGKENLETMRYKIKENKAVTSFVLMVLSFTVCWTPYATIGILSAFAPLKMPIWLLQTAALFAKTSTILNPVVYCWKDNLNCNFLAIFRSMILSFLYRGRYIKNI